MRIVALFPVDVPQCPCWCNTVPILQDCEREKKHVGWGRLSNVCGTLRPHVSGDICIFHTDLEDMRLPLSAAFYHTLVAV